jgi:hypothetical protein
MNVSGKEYVWQGLKQNKTGSILKALPEDGWLEASCGNGSKGIRVYDWTTAAINPPPAEGFARTLLVRRSQTSPDDVQAYICFAPSNTPMQKLIEIAGTRWTIETCFKESKSQTGLDQYEVRSYNGWYKHITFACIALALLSVLSNNSLDGLTMQEHNPATKSLDTFKKGRNLRV